jgi:hypothetical protein
MHQGSAPAPKKRPTEIARTARRTRIFARLSEGWAYDEIARKEKLTPRRVRQIVAEFLDNREVENNSRHTLAQLARLGPALRTAGEAVAQGDVRAIAPLMKVLDRLDHYQRAARAETVDRPDEPEAEDRQEPPPQAGEALVEERWAILEANAAGTGADDGREAPSRVETSQSGDGVATPPEAAKEEVIFPLCY